MYKSVPYPLAPIPYVQYILLAMVIVCPAVLFQLLILKYISMSDSACFASFFGILIVWSILVYAIWKFLIKRYLEGPEDEEDEVDLLLES